MVDGAGCRFAFFAFGFCTFGFATFTGFFTFGCAVGTEVTSGAGFVRTVGMGLRFGGFASGTGGGGGFDAHSFGHSVQRNCAAISKGVLGAGFGCTCCARAGVTHQVIGPKACAITNALISIAITLMTIASRSRARISGLRRDRRGELGDGTDQRPQHAADLPEDASGPK